MAWRISTIVFTVVFASIAHGEQLDCNKIPDYKQMVECFVKAAQSADAQLNSTYKDVLRMFSQQDVKTLVVDAQRRWLAFRDAQCALEVHGAAPGSSHIWMMAVCGERLTSARVKELRLLLASCEEGVVNCPAL